MNDEILPAFQSEWEKQTGERVEFITSFAGSGTITNQIILGVPADIAILSTELDAYRLVENQILQKDAWRQLPNQGILNRSPFIILVRAGNPKGIDGFEDLTKPGVGIVHPDPLTSGGAQWAILAEYGSALLTAQNEEQAYDQLAGIWKNVVAQPELSRLALRRVERHLSQAQETLAALGVPTEYRIKEHPNLVEGITHEAENGDYDPVVIGASFQPHPHQLRWMDIASRIIQGTSRPVLVVPTF